RLFSGRRSDTLVDGGQFGVHAVVQRLDIHRRGEQGVSRRHRGAGHLRGKRDRFSFQLSHVRVAFPANARDHSDAGGPPALRSRQRTGFYLAADSTEHFVCGNLAGRVVGVHFGGFEHGTGVDDRGDGCGGGGGGGGGRVVGGGGGRFHPDADPDAGDGGGGGARAGAGGRAAGVPAETAARPPDARRPGAGGDFVSLDRCGAVETVRGHQQHAGGIAVFDGEGHRERPARGVAGNGAAHHRSAGVVHSADGGGDHASGFADAFSQASQSRGGRVCGHLSRRDAGGNGRPVDQRDFCGHDV